MKLKITIVFLLIVCTGLSSANDNQDVREAIVSAAKNFVLQELNGSTNLQVETGRIDRRLKFKPCSQALYAYLPTGSHLRGNTTVGIQCPDQEGWQYFLPVKISLYENVIVAVKNIPRGHRIQASDLELKEIDISRIRGTVFYTKDAIVGSVAKRAIRQQSMVRGRSVCLVCKGDRVKIVAKNTAINVAMTGLALQDGSEGDLILVKNLSSSRKVEAQVTRPGQVDVNF